MDNIAHHVPRMAQRQPHTLAIVQPIGKLHQGRLPYRHFTFQELHRETDRLALGLEKVGLRRGMRTVLMVPPSLEFYALTFALFKLGAVIVLIDPGMGVKNLGVCLKEADLTAGLSALERLRKGLREKPIVLAPDKAVPVTVSFGLAVCTSAVTSHELLRRADVALYRAKSEGRDRIVVAES